MKKRHQIALAVLAVAGAAVLATGAIVSVYALRSLPQVQGHARLPGLNAPALVHRDASDVTHIEAQSPLDAFRTLGMVHAQERAWQLEFNRRVMHGTLAEVLGAAALPTDKLMRTLGIRQAAQAQWQGLPDHAKAALQAYADGVNSFMVQPGQALTPEFLALGIEPRAAASEGRFWTPADSVGWALMMALDLGGNWGNEFARLSSLKVLDTGRLWELFPPYPGEEPAASADLAALYRQLGVFSAAPEAPVKVSKIEAENPISESTRGIFYSKFSSPLQASLAQGVVDWTQALGEVEGKGSNNWVVAGSHTATGKPLLANDPHLGLSAPAIWYFARLKAPAAAGQEALDVVGATLPGLPFVVLGRNAHMAWGFTNTAPDVQDLYLEQINPANPSQYRVPSAPGQPPAWASFDTRQETIRVKGQGDVTHDVRHTRHGPVLSDAQASHGQVLDTSRYVLALRWSALDADNQTILAGLEGVRARSVDELIHAYRHYHSPMQNVVMADVHGRVAYKASGKVPVRAADNDINGVAPSPGWDARYDWQGWIPYDQTPETRFGATPVTSEPGARSGAPLPVPVVGTDGAGPVGADRTAQAHAARAAASAQAAQRGWLATANQRIHGTDYPHFLTQDWAPSYRQERIEKMLQERPRHDLDSMREVHGDQLSLATVRLLGHLQRIRSEHPLAAQAQAALKDFDGVMRAEQAAPLIFTAWVDAFTRQVVGRQLGEERFRAMYGKRNFRSAVEGILERDDTFWCGQGGCAEASRRALDTALDELQARHGRQVDRWQWGAAHAAVSRHQPFSNVKPLAPLFEVRVPTGGDNYTVNVGQIQLSDPALPYANRHAASLRAVYDLSNLDNSRFIYQTGQSGNVFSPRYRDMAKAWAAVQYRALQLQPPSWSSTLRVSP